MTTKHEVIEFNGNYIPNAEMNSNYTQDTTEIGSKAIFFELEFPKKFIKHSPQPHLIRSAAFLCPWNDTIFENGDVIGRIVNNK